MQGCSVQYTGRGVVSFLHYSNNRTFSYWTVVAVDVLPPEVYWRLSSPLNFQVIAHFTEMCFKNLIATVFFLLACSVLCEAHQLSGFEEARRTLSAFAGNPGSMALDEYSAILSELQARGPCNLLVFGMGKDSAVWAKANAGGSTLFVENSPEWAALCPYCDAIMVNYWTNIRDHGSLQLLGSPSLLLEPVLKVAAARRSWDVIIVDAPMGWSEHLPGRMQSISTAAALANPSTTVRACLCLHFMTGSPRPLAALTWLLNDN